MKKTIITVLRKDTVGIMAKVCNYLAEANVNILDISQTIVSDYFNMMMVVDITDVDNRFLEIADGLTAVGREKAVEIHIQREEIFDSMHRI